MRILCVIGYPGYMRYFDSTLTELLRRGHSITLAFDRPDYQPEGMQALDAVRSQIEFLDPPPRRQDLYGPFVRGLRAAVDYARYLDPRFEDADYLRSRRKKALELSEHFGFLARVPMQSPRRARQLLCTLLALEAATPSSSEVEAFIRSAAPDLVVVSPLVSQASPQTDIVKSAQALGIPTMLWVASWDHLTTKGLIRIVPGRIAVWNETQRAEAVSLHNVHPDRVIVTGAQPFDRWFGREPSRDRSAFCRRVGLPDDRPFLLFTGSTGGISRPAAEEAFVLDWVRSLRASDDPRLRDVGVLIRPHPYNVGTWPDADLSDLGPTALWPRGSVNPVDEDNRADYFDSLFHSAAVVGLNTSAMIEAAIIGRPVHTILAPEFTATQRGTLHFHYMLPENGGFLRSGSNREEHLAQLSDTLANPDKARQDVDRFVETFIRPYGLEQAATPLLADAVESAAATPAGRSNRMTSGLLRGVVALLAISSNRRWRADQAEARAESLAAHLDSLADRLVPYDKPKARSLREWRRRLTRRARERARQLREEDRRRITTRKAATSGKAGRRSSEGHEPPASLGAAQEGID